MDSCHLLDLGCANCFTHAQLCVAPKLFSLGVNWHFLFAVPLLIAQIINVQLWKCYCSVEQINEFHIMVLGFSKMISNSFLLALRCTVMLSSVLLWNITKMAESLRLLLYVECKQYWVPQIVTWLDIITLIQQYRWNHRPAMVLIKWGWIPI